MLTSRYDRDSECALGRYCVFSGDDPRVIMGENP